VNVTVFWDIALCISYQFTDVSEMLASIMVLMMKAADTSETSVNLCETTRRNIPEDSHFQKFRIFFSEHAIGVRKEFHMYRVLVGKPEGKNHLKDQGVDGRMGSK
jgi:hypothetical protein